MVKTKGRPCIPRKAIQLVSETIPNERGYAILTETSQSVT